MKKSYVKSQKEYEPIYKLDSDKIVAAMKRYKTAPKKPTSVSLDETTIRELKTIGEKVGIPYQVLIRVFILDGLEKMKTQFVLPKFYKGQIKNLQYNGHKIDLLFLPKSNLILKENFQYNSLELFPFPVCVI